jgi:hypothetical protein
MFCCVSLESLRVVFWCAKMYFPQWINKEWNLEGLGFRATWELEDVRHDLPSFVVVRNGQKTQTWNI